ncbi:MAG: hypothetical protein MZV65_13150 [Chromatiales bacterium]|nr:hypothetical protein [Chromatiales bacterium]
MIGGSLNQASPLGDARRQARRRHACWPSIVRLLDRAQSEKPRIGAAGRPRRRLVRARLLLLITPAVGLSWYVIDPCQRWLPIAVVDAGRHLPLRAVAGHPGRAHRRHRPADAGWAC